MQNWSSRTAFARNLLVVLEVISKLYVIILDLHEQNEMFLCIRQRGKEKERNLLKFVIQDRQGEIQPA